jgi:hypothetical protein
MPVGGHIVKTRALPTSSYAIHNLRLGTESWLIALVARRHCELASLEWRPQRSPARRAGAVSDSEASHPPKLGCEVAYRYAYGWRDMHLVTLGHDSSRLCGSG